MDFGFYVWWLGLLTITPAVQSTVFIATAEVKLAAPTVDWVSIIPAAVWVTIVVAGRVFLDCGSRYQDHCFCIQDLPVEITV